MSLIPKSVSALSALSAIPLLSLCLFSSCGNNPDQPLAANGQVQGLSSPTAASSFAQAKADHQSGKIKSAIKAYQSIADDYPLSAQAPEARFQEASLLYANGDLLESFDTYQKFIDKYKSSNLYASAIQNQSEVALAAASGDIKNNFVGIKSKVAGTKVEKMLKKVIENAPYSKEAPKAQFAIGSAWQERGDKDKAIAGYKGMQERYPTSSLTPEALYRCGSLLLAQTSKGNANQASIDTARNFFLDLRQQYPSHPRSKQAKAKLAQLNVSDIQRSFDIAEFYRKKGNIASAVFYYREVIRSSSAGTLREKAQLRLSEIGQ